MPFIKWTEDLSVGVAELDSQHKSLIDLANALYDSINNGNDREILGKALDRLLDYIAFHFGSEESLFQKYGFPYERTHKREHDQFSWRVLDMRGRWNRGEDLQISEVQDFLSDWIQNHILHSDKEYAGFFKSKGVR
ncbi:MAG: bacteriohemerythrin [Bacteroidetes bacterium]|nr:bacteriohemerythrin [Bacteroidota bacterium]